MRASGLAVEDPVEADLHFSDEETRAVLHNVADVTPVPDTLASIKVDLEGWIVGLRMLCLALRNGGNLHGYLSGQHGHIAQVHEYLAEQVLSRQSPELQRCLQRTSILERFCAPLCEVLCCSDEPGAAHAPQLSGQAFVGLFPSPTCLPLISTTVASGCVTITCSRSCCVVNWRRRQSLPRSGPCTSG